MGYGKILVKDKQYRWNEKEKKLIKEKKGKDMKQRQMERGERKREGLRICFWNVVDLLNKCDETWNCLGN